MEVAKDTVVRLSYELYGTDGDLIEKAEEPIEYLHGGYDGIFEAVERALSGKKAGDTCRIRLEPEDAFGDYDAELVQMEPLDKFPKNVAVGMQFEGQSGESGKIRVYTVTDIADGKVMLDGNHPLAGRALDFACRITAVRAATKEEITHGHVHGAHGHHH